MCNDKERLIVRTKQNITYIGDKVKPIEERVVEGVELKVHPFSEMRVFIPYCEANEIIKSSFIEGKENVEDDKSHR